jgi:uncharacterized membrane protein YgcG
MAALHSSLRGSRLPRFVAAVVLAALLTIAAAVAPAGAEMRTKQLTPHLCKTVGGGRFVDIPWSSGEMVDRRLLRDIGWMRRHFQIFVTDGYSLDPIHARRGEHPIGLAIDVIPDRSRGGTWSLITDLAKWAEPKQDAPRLPFRWVGYNGDAGHGRGNHLHLSWAHSETPYNDPARIVYTRICPDAPTGGGDGGGGKGDGSGGTGSGGGGGDGDGGIGSGGLAAPGKLSLAPVVPEVS